MKKVVIGIVAVAAAIALVVCLVPLKEVAYAVMVDYQEMEPYYEDEPYEATETYYEAQPLAYEVVKSYTETGSYRERRRIIIGGVVFQDAMVQVFYPVGCVTVKNKDAVSGTFTVRFTFYVMDRSSAAQLCHPDFDFADYLAAEDQEAYLASLDWGKLNLERFMFFADKYNGEEALTLEPGQTGTARHSAQDIDMNRFAWRWDYTITAGTKQVEQQRTVTKYRQVEKERTVTRQRQELRYKKVTLLDYWLHY